MAEKELTREELLKQKAALDAQIKALDARDAGKAFENAIEIARNYAEFFTSEQKKELAQALGLKPSKASKATKKTRPASTKPKKFRLPTGEEWGGQGGDRMAPTAFKEWRKSNPKAEWPKNPDYTA